MNSYYCEGLDQSWYLYYYFKYPVASDYLNAQIVAFKEDKKEQSDIFSKIVYQALRNSNFKFDYVTRALGSNELEARKGNRVIPLAKAAAEATGAEYIPGLLCKGKPTRPFKRIFRKAERAAELEGVYHIKKNHPLDNKKILIVDDISTSGTTLTAIAKVIKENYGNVTVCSFCLAHTKSLEWDHVDCNPNKWAQEYKEMLGSA